MKIIKTSIKLLLLISIIALSSKIWIKYNLSFRIDKIQPYNFFNNTIDLKEQKEIDLSTILDQQYSFLSKGRQSFVFESRDNKYVIKFFRFHRYRQPIWSKCFSFFNFFRSYIDKLQYEKKDLYTKTMNSYKLAFEDLKDETATIYVHLNKTHNLNKKLIIKDKFRKKYLLDLDNLGFVIQKKAQPFIEALLNVKDDKNAVALLIGSFFDNLESIYKKDILNKDRHVMQNLGLIDDRVVEIDIGRFSKKKFNKNKLQKEANHYTVYLKKWLSKNISDSQSLVDDRLVKLIGDK